MGMFIEINLQKDKLTPRSSQLLASVCPVDIFIMKDHELRLQQDRDDECTLCERCLDVAPLGAVRIRKTYKNEELLSRGG